MTERKIIAKGKEVKTIDNYTFYFTEGEIKCSNAVKMHFRFQLKNIEKGAPLMVDNKEIKEGDKFEDLRFYTSKNQYFSGVSTYKGIDRHGSYLFEIFPCIVNTLKIDVEIENEGEEI